MATGTPVARFGAVVLDCPDPVGLAGFYSALTGWSVAAGATDEWVGLYSPLGFELAFQLVTDYVAPAWPGREPPQQFHLDFYVPDLEAAEATVRELGAVPAGHQPGRTYRVFLDPVGHPFCLCVDTGRTADGSGR